MDGFGLNTFPKVNFVFDFKLPHGYLPFGYTKNTLPINIFNIFENKEIQPYTLYHSSVQEPSKFTYSFASPFTTYFVEHTKNTKFITTSEIDFVKRDELYYVVIESNSNNNMFEYYNRIDFRIEDLISKKLINLLKTCINFKLIFMDIQEGAYPHSIEFLEKINNFLLNNNIYHIDKVIISSNNNFIKKIKDNEVFKKFENKINLYANNYCLLTAGKYIGQLRSNNNLIVENEYDFSIQENINFEKKEKYFLMYNRNSERMHRPYFVNKLYENNLLEKGFISFFQNDYLDSFLENTKSYEQLQLDEDDIKSIKTNYKKYTPLIIDNANSNEIANYHNFLSRKNEYENSYFTIVSETNAESDYCFITEKTTKPIMNLHPFVVVGNPHTLNVLKKYGFKTFDRWWDESYDDEFDFKTRSSMVLSVVKDLCSKSHNELNIMLKEMSETLKYNKKLLHKLSYKNEYQNEFYKETIGNKFLINTFKSII